MQITKQITILILLIGNLIFAQNSPSETIIHNFLSKEYPKEGPGAAILIAKDNKIIYKEAFGLADIKKKKAMRTDMVFQLGSMTKQFTSAAVLQLVEKGKVNLDDPIQKYVSYFPDKEHTITIHHLLSQTSGLPEFFDVDEEELHLLSQEHTPGQLIAYYKDAPLNFKPGTKFQYSNSNYPLLGVVVEKTSGMSLETYLHQNIFAPLGMNSSNLWYSKKMKKSDIVKGYRYYKGKLLPSPKIVGSTPYAAGAMVSTIDDLYIWNRELANNTVLSDEVIKELITEKQLESEKGTGYTYGFFIKELLGHKTIQHGGDMYGFTSYALYLPKEDLFVCVLTNEALERTEEVANYMASVVLGEPIEILDKKQLAFAEYEEYFGTYQLKEGTKQIEIFMTNDVLVLDFPEARGTGDKLSVIAKDKMQMDKVKVKINFTRDEKGAINGFTADQNGITIWEKL